MKQEQGTYRRSGKGVLSRLKASLPAGVVVLGLVFGAAAQGDPPAIYNLGTSGGFASYGYAINASGQVVGKSYVTGDTAWRGFLYCGTPGGGGTMADLGTLGGTYSWASGINASGQIAGAAYIYPNDISEWHAFLYTGTPGAGGTMADLGTLGGKASSGSAINAYGQMTGESRTTGDTARHAFLYTGTPGSGGAMADLGTLGGTYSSGYAINASGEVAGESSIGGGSGSTHAFLYTGTPGSGGAMADLGTLGGNNSYAYGINDAGQVVGYSDTTNIEPVYHAFLYTGMPGSGGAMVDLGIPGRAYAVNARGQVAGSSYNATASAFHAFLYVGTPGIDGYMTDLDTWLDVVNPAEGAKWTLSSANGLTDTGLITGTGTFDDGVSSDFRAFILDASSLVPEPGTISLLGLGAMGLLGRRRR